jgi:DNA-binding CsgD family transcriptional regulator
VPHLRSTIAFVSSQLFAGRTSDAKRGAEGALRRADEMSTQLPTAQGILRAQLAFAGLWRGELGSVPNSDPLNGRWPAPPGMAPDGRDFEWALMAGIVAHQRGDHGQAVARLREAVVQQAAGKGIFHSEACAWLVVALCDDGSPAEAESVMQRFPTRHLAVVPGVVDWAAGALACANGRTSEGSRLLGRAAQEAASVGATLCEAWYLIEQADRAASDEGVSRLADLGDLLDAPLLQALCRTTVARAKGDTATMLGCSTTLAAAGLVARAVSVCRDVERMARHCDAPEQARSAARHRRQLQGDRCAAGRHPHLSVREEEVATLAAGGLSDRQIAARLIVSVRTVESHLASAYRKLGVASRAHLAGAL